MLPQIMMPNIYISKTNSLNPPSIVQLLVSPSFVSSSPSLPFKAIEFPDAHYILELYCTSHELGLVSPSRNQSLPLKMCLIFRFTR